MAVDSQATAERIGLARPNIRYNWTPIRVLGALGLTFVILIAVVSIFAPMISPIDPNEQDARSRLRPPAWVEGGSSANLLGTDQLGRDVLTRMMYGGRISL